MGPAVYPRAVSRRPPQYLFVCTANINRSPAAAAVAKERLTSEHFIAAQIRSASALGWDGYEAGAYTMDAMRELGFDLREHRSSPLTAEVCDWADKIVVMEPGHARRVLELAPHVEDRVLGLWDWMEGLDHVPDPQGEDLDTHRVCMKRIQGATERLVDDLVAELRAARRR